MIVPNLYQLQKHLDVGSGVFLRLKIGGKL